MSKDFRLEATKRDETGKGANRKLRKKGLIPAVIYSKKLDPINLSISPKYLREAVSGPKKMNTLIELAIAEMTPKLALLKDYQINPISRNYIHADFIEVRLDEKIAIRVPINIIGKAVGLLKNGIVQIIRRSITISCLPSDIPESIDVDVSSLDIGDSIHVGDVGLKEGMEAIDNDAFTIVTCVTTEKEEVEEEAEDEETAAKQEEEKSSEPAKSE